MSFREALEGIKTKKNMLDNKATVQALDEMRPLVKEYIDARLSMNSSDSLNEQQLGVASIGGFPIHTQMAVPNQPVGGLSGGNPLGGVVNEPYAGEPVITTVKDTISLADLEAFSQQQFDEPSLPEEMEEEDEIDFDATLDTTVELDSEDDIVDDSKGNNVIPAVPDDLSKNIEDINAIADSISDNDEEPQNESFDEDLVKVVDPESLVGGEEENGDSEDEMGLNDLTLDDLEIENDEEEEDDDDYIIIHPQNESKNIVGVKVTSADVNSQFRKVEALYSLIKESDDLMERLEQLEKIQETLGENKTLREVVKQALTDGSLSSDVFKGIYEVSLSIDRSLSNLNTIYENTELEIEEDEEISESSCDVTESVNENNSEEENLDESCECNTKEINEQKLDLANDLKKSKFLKVTKNITRVLEARNKMRKRKVEDETIEIDMKDLKEAVSRFKRRNRLSENVQSEAGDGGTPPEPRTKKSLGDSDGTAHTETPLPAHSLVHDPEEVEADEYAATSDMRSKAFESLKRENQVLKRQLGEAKLVNQKLMHAVGISRLENLSDSQKKAATKKIKEAKTLDEANLIFEFVKEQAVDGNKNNTINEGRVRAGASSRVINSSAPTKTLNEGSNVEAFGRWSQLAGLK